MKALFSRGDKLAFLKDRYEGTDTDFGQTLDGLTQAGLHELGARLPFESPDYDPDSIKYREGDAALVYLLRYDLPRLLADNNIPIAINDDMPMTAAEIEYAVLAELFKLIDPTTNGMIRYEDDSYQGINFHTNEVQLIVKGIKRKVQHDAKQNGDVVDLDQKQSLRGQLTPQGKPPAWTHPLGQLSSWAAKRARTAEFEGDTDTAEWYAKLSTFCLNSALSTVTGENQWHAVLDENGKYVIRQVPQDKQPECIVANKPQHGTLFNTPSSHTPLNWSTAMLKEAVGMLGMYTKQRDIR
jgi:hypothetical protein